MRGKINTWKICMWFPQDFRFSGEFVHVRIKREPPVGWSRSTKFQKGLHSLKALHNSKDMRPFRSTVSPHNSKQLCIWNPVQFEQNSETRTIWTKLQNFAQFEQNSETVLDLHKNTSAKRRNQEERKADSNLAGTTVFRTCTYSTFFSTPLISWRHIIHPESCKSKSIGTPAKCKNKSPLQKGRMWGRGWTQFKRICDPKTPKRHHPSLKFCQGHICPPTHPPTHSQRNPQLWRRSLTAADENPAGDICCTWKSTKAI